MFIMEMMFSSLTRYYEEEANLIKTRTKIINNYLKTKFFYDLVALIPLIYLLISKDPY